MSNKVLKLTREQLERVVGHIESNKMRKPVGFINEDYYSNKEILEEGKMTSLIIAAALGVILSGSNKAMAQKGINHGPSITQAINDISSDEGLDAVADSLEAAGLKDAKEKILNNAERVESKLNAKAFQVTGSDGKLKIKHGKKLKTTNVNTYKNLAKKLKAGYAITSISQDTVRKLAVEHFPSEEVIDSLSVTMGADDLFTTGAYTLNDDAAGAIQSYLDNLNSNGFVIIGVTIESSTDFERIDMGNEKLAQLRAEAIQGAIDGKVPSNLININTLPNNGPDVYSKLYVDYEEGKMSASEFKDKRNDLRKTKTHKYRYCNIIVDGFIVTDTPPVDTVIETEEDVIVYNFGLVKVYSDQFTLDLTFNWVGNYKENKTKCNTDCPSWSKGQTSGAHKSFTGPIKE